MKVLLVSNLDSRAPFGSFTRPFFLGRALAELGIDVANVAIDPTAIDFGPTARATPKPMWRFDRVLGLRARQHGRWRAAAARRQRAAPALRGGCCAPSPGTRGGRRRDTRRAAAPVHTCSHAPRIPNGVDPEFLAAPLAPDSPYEPGIRHAVSTLPNSGNPSNSLALEFLGVVAGELAMRTPAVRVNVLGSAHGPGEPRVRYHGLQAELLLWIGHADTCLLPYPDEAQLYGGARNKLLEYLARGRSLVTSTEGLRGLQNAKRNPKVTVAPAEPAAFAAAVI